MTALRIDMEQNPARLSDKDWNTKLGELQSRIVGKIEQFSSRAEATAYRNVGNLQRPINTNMGGFLHPLYLDICIRDIDYLNQFIIDYSRKREI
jgi:hypothetical protein